MEVTLLVVLLVLLAIQGKLALDSCMNYMKCGWSCSVSFNFPSRHSSYLFNTIVVWLTHMTWSSMLSVQSLHFVLGVWLT